VEWRTDALSGISFWHSVNSAKWNGDNQLWIAKAAVLKMVPESSKKEKRLPVMLEHMLTLVRGLDLSNSFGLVVWACAVTLFKGVCRGGEFLVLSCSAFKLKYHITRNTSLKWGKLTTSLEWLNIRIPWTKTTHSEGALITLTTCDEVMNPLPAVRHHLWVNATVPNTASFFSFVMAVSWEPLTKDWFINRCNAVWKEAGFEDELLIHDFCIGGTTEMLLRGTPLDIVMVQGHWLSTQSFVLYWHKIEDILPLFLSRSFIMDCMTRLNALMKDFCARYQH
jgi:type IV secretory pathway TrbD component